MHSLRLLRSSSLPRLQKRALIYESSRFSVPDYERKLIEKSKEAGGLRFTLLSANGLDELLNNVVDHQEEISLGGFRLGHVMHFPRIASNSFQQYSSSLQTQLDQLSEISSVNKTEIDSISVSVPINILFEELQNKILLTQILHFQSKQATSNHNKIGYYLSTETLHKLPDHQIKEVGVHLSNSNIDFLSLAVNPFTYKSAMSISQQLKSKMAIQAMEVLRCHPAIPGQINSSYEYLPAHVRRFDPESPATSNTNPTSSQTTPTLSSKIISSQSVDNLSEEERLGVHDLHNAFDRAIAMEKALLAKHPENVQELVTACVAHNLSRRHFQYVEEFDYIIETRVKAQFENFSKAKEQDINMKNWIILHRPVLTYLFSSYRSFLAGRQLDLSHSIAEIVSRSVMHDVQESGSESLKWMPYRLAALAKQAVNAEDVGLTLTTVGKEGSNVKIPQMSKEQIVKVYEEIGRVYKDYYHTEEEAAS